jgi:hypothetical protein
MLTEKRRDRSPCSTKCLLSLRPDAHLVCLFGSRGVGRVLAGVGLVWGAQGLLRLLAGAREPVGFCGEQHNGQFAKIPFIGAAPTRRVADIYSVRRLRWFMDRKSSDIGVVPGG